jgi:hypothetical protein
MCPIFLAISHGWLNIEGKFKYCFPLALIWTFTYRPSWTINWGAHVITTYFVDVLSFGNLTLLFDLLSFGIFTTNLWASKDAINIISNFNNGWNIHSVQPLLYE